VIFNDLWGQTSYYEKFVFYYVKNFKQKDIKDFFYKSDLMHGTFNKLWGQDTFYENIASL
jgi:hypothetical protein